MGINSQGCGSWTMQWAAVQYCQTCLGRGPKGEQAVGDQGCWGGAAKLAADNTSFMLQETEGLLLPRQLQAGHVVRYIYIFTFKLCIFGSEVFVYIYTMQIVSIRKMKWRC